MADRDLFRRWYGLKRLLYRGDRPGCIAKALNRFWAWQYGSGRLGRVRDVTLQVRGRSTGDPVTLPVVLADHAGGWYLVSMLGENAGWVRNVRAAGGAAVIRHGGEHPVTLHEVPVADRAPILRRYLDVAPGARPHIPVPRAASPAEFERIASSFPVFRITGNDWPPTPEPGR